MTRKQREENDAKTKQKHIHKKQRKSSTKLIYSLFTSVLTWKTLIRNVIHILSIISKKTKIIFHILLSLFTFTDCCCKARREITSLQSDVPKPSVKFQLSILMLLDWNNSSGLTSLSAEGRRFFSFLYHVGIAIFYLLHPSEWKIWEMFWLQKYIGYIYSITLKVIFLQFHLFHMVKAISLMPCWL